MQESFETASFLQRIEVLTFQMLQATDGYEDEGRADSLCVLCGIIRDCAYKIRNAVGEENSHLACVERKGKEDCG